MFLRHPLTNQPKTQVQMANNNSSSKATVAQVKIGHIKIEGLMLPDGSFAIAVPQISSLFLIPIKNTSRDFKALLGGDFQFLKVGSEIHPKAVNILTLPEFEMLSFELALKENQFAIDFHRSLAGLTLHQLYCDAFGVKFEQQDRQNWLKERQEGKLCRRSLTDATKLLIEQGEKLNYGYITLQTYTACQLSTKYKEYKSRYKDDHFRDTLTDGEIRNVKKFEELTADYVLVDRLPLNQAMAKAARYIR